MGGPYFGGRSNIFRENLYVYLDTTRGLHHRHGVKDVRRRGAGHRVRHARKRRVRRCSDAAVRKKGAPRRSLFSHTSAPFRQGGKLTKFAFSLFHRAEEAEACPFMVYPRLFC